MTDRFGQRFGNYQLMHLLGQGGFADVYLARHVYLQSPAAIKLLHTHLRNSDRELFLREACTLIELKHPHILQVLDFGEEQDVPYLVMTYAEHGTLRQRYRSRVLPLKLICSYVEQAASALQYAHEHKIIHRDIKPENMLLDRADTLLLSDFGIALPSQSSHWQNDACIAGTGAYMAPEQIQGKSRRSSDQYALAVVAYEWLVGETPFHGTLKELASQHLLLAPPSLQEKDPGIAPAIEEVILRALAKEPDARFATIEVFARALAAAAGETSLWPAASQGSTLLHSSLPPNVALAWPDSPSGSAPTRRTPLPPTVAVARRSLPSNSAPTQMASSVPSIPVGSEDEGDAERRPKRSEPLSPDLRADIISTIITCLDPSDEELGDLEEEDVKIGLISLTCWLSVYACLLGVAACIGIFLTSFLFWPAEAMALGALNLFIAPSVYVSTRHRRRALILLGMANLIALLLALSLRNTNITDSGGIVGSLFTGFVTGFLAAGTAAELVFPLLSGSTSYLLRKLPRIIALDGLMVSLWVGLWFGGSFIGEPAFIAQHALACLWSTVAWFGIGMLLIAKGWGGR